MATIHQLLVRLNKLEGRSKADAEFQVAQVDYPGDEFWAPCEFAMIRNGEAVFRFPQRLTIEQWEAKYSTNPVITRPQ